MSRPQQRLLRNHILLSLALTLLLTALFAALYRSNTFSRADHLIYDAHFRVRGPAPVSGDIVLVLMDQASSEELGRKQGSWSRAHMARALHNLSRAGAEVVGLDMVFFSPSEDPTQDQALASAMAKCNNVVLAWFVAVEGRGEVRPLPLFQKAMIGDGFVNMIPDQDGVLRKVPFLSIQPVDQGVAVFPGFPLEMVRVFKNLDFALDFTPEDHFVLGTDQDSIQLPFPDLRINYAGREEVFSRLRYADVVHNRFSSHLVQDKMVLIGSALATDKDFFATPFSGSSHMESQYKETFGKVLTGDLGRNTSGVACHAHAIETILQEKYIHKAPSRLVLLLILVTGITGLIFYPQRPGALWGVLILLFASALVLFLAHQAFVRGLWVEISPVLFLLGTQYVAGIGVQRSYSRKRTRMVTGLFGKYVSQGVARDLLQGHIDLTLEGSSAQVTVLFTDLRSFTSISETLTPAETGRLLNTYFDAMIPAVFRHDGTLDKLIGDAVMAFFGAPAPMPDHPSRAALTALDMVGALKDLRSRSDVKGVEQLAMGIGLNSGEVTAGNLGSRSFMDYTVIGDTVNLASRLEGLTKHYGAMVILSRETASHLDERFLLRELDLVQVKGRDRPVTIYELVGLQEQADPSLHHLIQAFEAGLHHYRNRAWTEAQKAFEQALAVNAQDKPSALYLKRVRACSQNPPPPDWKGVRMFDSK